MSSDLQDDIDDIYDALDDMSYGASPEDYDFALLFECMERVEAHMIELERRVKGARRKCYNSGVVPPYLERTEYERLWVDANTEKAEDTDG